MASKPSGMSSHAQHQSWPEKMYSYGLQALFGLGFTFSKDTQDDTKWLFLFSAFVSEV